MAKKKAAVLDAPVAELVPLIKPPMWVRFANAKDVPNHLVGRDGVVDRAITHASDGGDAMSPAPYEFQDGSEVFLVRARDTGEVLELTRDAFAKFADTRVGLDL